MGVRQNDLQNAVQADRQQPMNLEELKQTGGINMSVVCRVHDHVSKLWEPPFPCESAGAAARAFETALKDPEHKYGMWPDDFVLYLVGEYSPHTPEILPVNPETRLVSGKEVQAGQQAALAAQNARVDAQSTKTNAVAQANAKLTP